MRRVKNVEDAMSTSVLEKDIVAMLADGAASSASVASMIEKVERVVAVAERMAAAEKTKALDLTQTPDPTAALTAMEETAIARDRLVAVLPRLQQKYTALCAQEDRGHWEAEHARVKALVDAEAEKFAEVGDLLVRLAERFAAAKAVDEQVAHFNISSPPGMHIDDVELVARNIQSFCRDWPSIIDKAVIPSWQPTSKLLWPPPRNAAAFAAMFAPVPFDPRYSPLWHEVSEAKQRELLRQAEEAAAK